MEPNEVERDYPNIRKSNQCPLCIKWKETGLLVCWLCWNKYDGRGGFSAADQSILHTIESRYHNPDLPSIRSHRRRK